MSTQSLQQEVALTGTPAWRKLFKTKSEMDSSPVKFPISGFLPEGITFIGALSESGKTWFCLSMAKAICSGQRFLGRFAVNEQSTVLYLIPECGERSFRQRMEIMGIPDGERFLCRTISDGPIKLENLDLLSAVRELKPVIFLDTAVRFNESVNENDASQAAHELAEKLFALLKAGAKAVVCVHHSQKGSGNQPPTLENSLRGSGDLGAMADCVYRLKVEDRDSLRIRVQNVKARDFEPVPPFSLQGRPFIDDIADFGLIQNIEEPQHHKKGREQRERFVLAVKVNPKATIREIAAQLHITSGTVQRIAGGLGWKKERGGPWVNPRAEPALAMAA